MGLRMDFIFSTLHHSDCANFKTIVILKIP